MISEISPVPCGAMFKSNGYIYEALNDKGSGVIEAHEIETGKLVKLEYDIDEKFDLLGTQRVAFFTPSSEKKEIYKTMKRQNFTLVREGVRDDGYFFVVYEKEALPDAIKKETTKLFDQKFGWRLVLFSLELGNEPDEEWNAKLDFEHPWRDWVENNPIPSVCENYQSLESFDYFMGN